MVHRKANTATLNRYKPATDTTLSSTSPTEAATDKAPTPRSKPRTISFSEQNGNADDSDALSTLVASQDVCTSKQPTCRIHTSEPRLETLQGPPWKVLYCPESKLAIAETLHDLHEIFTSVLGITWLSNSPRYWIYTTFGPCSVLQISQVTCPLILA